MNEELAQESRERRQRSADDIGRLQSLPLMEQLADRGDAMKIVPIFALKIMNKAAEEIKKLRLTEEERAVIEVCHWQTAPASSVLKNLLDRHDGA